MTQSRSAGWTHRRRRQGLTVGQDKIVAHKARVSFDFVMFTCDLCDKNISESHFKRSGNLKVAKNCADVSARRRHLAYQTFKLRFPLNGADVQCSADATADGF